MNEKIDATVIKSIHLAKLTYSNKKMLSTSDADKILIMMTERMIFFLAKFIENALGFGR